MGVARPGAAALLAAAAVAAGCAVPAGEELPADFVQVVNRELVFGYDAENTQLVELPDDAGLAGPGYAFTLGDLTVASRVDAEGARLNGLDGPVRTAEGHELLVVTIRYDPALAASRPDPWQGVTAEIAVDGRPRPLDLSGIDGVVPASLMVSVPEGAPTSLRVTEDGQTQAIDVRTGQITEREETHSERVRRTQRLDLTAELRGRVEGGGTRRPFTVVVRPGTVDAGAELDSYLPGIGWAESGRAWLVVSSFSFADDGLDLDRGQPVTLDLDLTDSFSLRLPAGGTRRPLPDGARAGAEAGVSGQSVVFEVPQDFRSGTLVFSPRGELARAAGGGDSEPLSWVDEPPTTEWDIEVR
ncbi:hypothetical protein [Allonocardiopsis opalescens]|uniref:Uncharacterized protein n=1 Tax=Allonocardiopsis opalescens TaxID=1144618 RepID=A0A2T0PWX3_9ACTN|nr:hypothetical protein [Allonocardiopsis opalescens]PRX96032.1 hypothetical protein CLV72_10836 [Allonocardiopsis opalescens]